MGSVRKRVYLFPLHKLNNKAIRLIREISVGIIQDVESFIEALHTAQ